MMLSWRRFLILEATRFLYACIAQWHRSRLRRCKGWPLSNKAKYHLQQSLKWTALKRQVGLAKEFNP